VIPHLVQFSRPELDPKTHETSIFDIFQVRYDEKLAITTKPPFTFAYMWHILVELIKLHTPVLKLIKISRLDKLIVSLSYSGSLENLNFDIF